MEQAVKKKRWGVFALLAVCAAVVLGVAAVWFALGDPGTELPEPPATPDGAVQKIAAAAVSGRPALLSGVEMASLINWQMDRWGRGDEWRIGGVRCSDPSPEGVAELYAPVYYRGLRFAVTASVSIQTEADRAAVRIHTLRAGRLAVNPEQVLPLLRRAVPTLPVSAGEGALSVPLQALRITALNDIASLEITAVSTAGGTFSVSALADLAGIREKARDKWEEFVRHFS